MYNSDNFTKLQFDSYNSYGETSKYKIDRIRNMLKEKKSELEEIKYIINIYEREQVDIIKDEVSYYWFSHSYIEYISKWIEMSKTKYDKRKKYTEKDMYDLISQTISDKLFCKKPIQIIGTMCGGYENYIDIIVFICEDMQFRLSIPNFKNINTKNISYAYYGKLTISVRTSSCSTTVIASDYDENMIYEDVEKFFNNEEEMNQIKEKTKDVLLKV